MSRIFYGYAIFFLTIYLLCSIVHNYTTWMVNEQLLELPSIVPWYITFAIAGILPWFFLIAYHNRRGYLFAFYCSLVSIVVTIISIIAFYHLILTHEITPFFALFTFLLLLSQVMMGGSLILSKAAERRWLKLSGIVLLITSSVTLITSVTSLVSFEARHADALLWINRANEIAGMFVLVFTLLNFVQEYRAAAENSERQEFFGVGLAFVSLSLIIATAVNGNSIVKDVRYSVANPDEVPEFIKRAAFPFMPDTYINNQGDTLRYRIMLPKGYDSTRSYPIVICLHGSTGAGKDNAKQILTCLPAQILSADGMRNNYPAFLFVPQAPRGMSFGGFTNLAGIDSVVIEAMRHLENKFSVDTTRRYVTGYSMGGFGAWSMISKWPELFAAAVPMCGKGDVEFADRITNKPIWAFHGAQDINVPVSGSRDMIEAIRRSGGSPRYTEFPDKAHDITRDVQDMPEWIDWMFKQKNN
jgi:dienelactone hydrolase